MNMWCLGSKGSPKWVKSWVIDRIVCKYMVCWQCQGQLAHGKLAKPLHIWTRLQRSGKDQVWVFMKDWSVCVQTLVIVVSFSGMFTAWGSSEAETTYRDWWTPPIVLYLINTLSFWVTVVRATWFKVHYMWVCVPVLSSSPTSPFRVLEHKPLRKCQLYLHILLWIICKEKLNYKNCR